MQQLVYWKKYNNWCGCSYFWSDAGSPVLGIGEQNCPLAATVCVYVYLSVCLYCYYYNCVLRGVLRGVTQADTIWWTTPQELFSYLSFVNSWRASAKIQANTNTYKEKYNHLIGRNTNKWWQAGGLERGGTCQDFTSVGLCPTPTTTLFLEDIIIVIVIVIVKIWHHVSVFFIITGIITVM